MKSVKILIAPQGYQEETLTFNNVSYVDWGDYSLFVHDEEDKIIAAFRKDIVLYYIYKETQ